MLWALLTVAAAATQTVRNALQRGLTERVGALGATHARFLYGLPFALVFLAVARAFGGPIAWPTLEGAALGALGGLAQIGATACLLAAMRSSAFLLAVAYTKSEPALVLLVAWAVLGEMPSLVQGFGILGATAGVMLMAWPGGAARAGPWYRAVLLGLGSGALFAVSAVAFRGAILTVEGAGFVTAALTVLALVLAFQTAVLSAWLAIRDPGVMRALVAEPRGALPAGFCGALASALWFAAFALASTALVRTLALVEVLFSQLVGRRWLAERISRREGAGVALMVGGIAALLLG
ncbi:MAG: DMT family transporter [Pseudomonadota bacterium]